MCNLWAYIVLSIVAFGINLLSKCCWRATMKGEIHVGSFGKETLSRACTCGGGVKVLPQHWPIVIPDDFILGLLWYF